MKKFIINLVIFVFIVVQSGCFDSQTPMDSDISISESSGATESESISQDETEYNHDMSNLPSTYKTVGLDQFGRTFDKISAYNSNKKVGMFFWLWIGQPYARDIYDATEILSMENGLEILLDPDSLDNEISPDGQAHFWGEPLWGYYNSDDEWVIRRQIEMLTYAGVDFIVFDTTNALTYFNVYTKILKIISEYISEGWNPPKVVFYTHSKSLATTNRIYNEIYRRGTNEEAWYKVDGKPMIIAYTNPVDDINEARSRGDHSYNPNPLPEEILEFFHFRRPQWPSDYYHPEGFPWIEWVFPQPMYEDRVMSVSVASHPRVPFSFSLTRGLINWGRGWDPFKEENIREDVEIGTFFQHQWDNAIEEDANTVFVGGWNEWIAYKQIWDGEYMLCDAVDIEYSRDIEPMKGGFQDAFFIQLIKNIREFKGIESQFEGLREKTIDIYGDISQWDSIKNNYTAVGEQNYGRDSFGAAKTVRYTLDAPENNIQEIKVSHDGENLYFYIKSEETIKGEGERSNWMNILLGTGKVEVKGWEGYEYIINTQASENTTDVNSLNENFLFEEEGNAKYNLIDNVLQIEIPRNLVGMDDLDEFYFKVSDGIERTEDIMDYYVTGKSLPMGRLSFVYIMD